MTNAIIVEKSHGAIIVNGTEDASGVTFSYSGTLDVTGLAPFRPTPGIPAFVDPSVAIFGSSDSSDSDSFADLYPGAFSSAPSSFGSGSGDIRFPTSIGADNDILSFGGIDSNFLLVPVGFTSGSLSGSTFFAGASFDSLGIDTNNDPYIYVLNNMVADTITLQFEAEPIPEPLTIMGTLLAGGIGAMMKKRKG